MNQEDTPKKLLTLSFLVKNYYGTQKERIQEENRLFAMGGEGIDEESIKGLREISASRLLSTENILKKAIESALVDFSIWENWLRDLPGIGPVLAGGLITYIGNIKRFANVSKLWAYAGLSVGYYKVTCQEGHRFVSSSLPEKCNTRVYNKEGEKFLLCGAPLEKSEHIKGKAIKKIAGHQIRWNPQLKTACWKTGEAFVKTKGPYRDFYDQFRQFYDSHPDHAEKSKGHRYSMAKRKTVKLFLSHLYEKWRKEEGLEAGKIYVIEKLKHEGYIAPPN